MTFICTCGKPHDCEKVFNTSSSNDAHTKTDTRFGGSGADDVLCADVPSSPVAPQVKEGQSLSSPKMISRFELILDGKRYKVVWPCEFDYSVQDNGRTLKCFVKEVKEKVVRK